MTARVLLVDDDAAVRDALSQTLELADLHPIPAGSFVVAKDHISRDFAGVIDPHKSRRVALLRSIQVGIENMFRRILARGAARRGGDGFRPRAPDRTGGDPSCRDFWCSPLRCS